MERPIRLIQSFSSPNDSFPQNPIFTLSPPPFPPQITGMENLTHFIQCFSTPKIGKERLLPFTGSFSSPNPSLQQRFLGEALLRTPSLIQHLPISQKSVPPWDLGALGWQEHSRRVFPSSTKNSQGCFARSRIFPAIKLLPQLSHFLSLRPRPLREILDPYRSERGHEKSS